MHVCLRTLPPPYREHHKPPNVTPSGSVEKQGREEASASAASCPWFVICSGLGGRFQPESRPTAAEGQTGLSGGVDPQTVSPETAQTGPTVSGAVQVLQSYYVSRQKVDKGRNKGKPERVWTVFLQPRGSLFCSCHSQRKTSQQGSDQTSDRIRSRPQESPPPPGHRPNQTPAARAASRSTFPRLSAGFCEMWLAPQRPVWVFGAVWTPGAPQ